MRSASVVLAFWLVTASGHTQSASPFDNLAGQWSGSGTIDLANGTRDPIRCRAAYDVLDQQNNLQLNIRCASDSYSFNLFASATLASDVVSGSWSETTRNAAGTISGTANGDHIDVVANGPTFSASLALITRGDLQSVVIRSKEAKSSVQGATISLERS
jgi:hypothetical protein